MPTFYKQLWKVLKETESEIFLMSKKLVWGCVQIPIHTHNGTLAIQSYNINGTRRIGQAEDSHLEKPTIVCTEGISECFQSRESLWQVDGAEIFRSAVCGTPRRQSATAKIEPSGWRIRCQSHRRQSKGKKPSSEYKLPIKTSQQYLKMGSKTLLEEIQQKPTVVKGDPLPMQSEHGWKAGGHTLWLCYMKAIPV